MVDLPKTTLHIPYDSDDNMHMYRIVPVVCIHCGMPLANKQPLYDELAHGRRLPLDEAFAACKITRACCKVVISRAPATDDLLRAPAPPDVANFCTITRVPSCLTPATPLVLSTNGHTPGM